MKYVLLILLVLSSVAVGWAEPAKPAGVASIASRVAGMSAMDGFVPLYWDGKHGRLYLEARVGREMIYAESLAAGVGVNAIGLDRGQPGQSALIRFERVGPRLLLVAANRGFRAEGAAREGVDEAFPRSVLWGFDVVAEDGDRVLVDATNFFLQDSHHVAARLDPHAAVWQLDATRSSIYLPRTKVFPRNTEVEASLTFTSDHPSGSVEAVTPWDGVVTVRAHHSFIALPEEGYSPREADRRGGFFSVRIMDFSAPLTSELTHRYITRFRLQKNGPRAVRRPIVYYVDRAAPEPVRTALLEGVGWWRDAFAAAGFPDGFRVEVLPPGVDPLDARYNVVEWVPRTTSGWSYGEFVADPRTGEIIHGHVVLDASRARRDIMIARGMAATADRQTLEHLGLARMRQLAAHEVGHSLGLMHNFAASTGSGSVMDYPPPVIRLDANGHVDLSHAYVGGPRKSGLGAWDYAVIAFGYGEYATPAAARQPLDTFFAHGGVFLSDEAAEGGASPITARWDAGADALKSLAAACAARRTALEHLGPQVLAPGEPLSTLSDLLVGVYLYPLNQAVAAAQSIGGVDYGYNTKGDRLALPRDVAGDRQRAAMAAVLDTLRPAALALPPTLVRVLAPYPPDFGVGPESFSGRTGPIFDAAAPAEAYAELIVPVLLDAQRAARMNMLAARDARCPAFRELVDALLDLTWRAAAPTSASSALIRHRVGAVVLRHLLALAADTQADAEVRGTVCVAVDNLSAWLSTHAAAASAQERAAIAYAQRLIAAFHRDGQPFAPTRSLTLPIITPL